MQYDFSQIEAQNFVTVPEGAYRCRVAEVRAGRARDGSDRWSWRLEVVGGEYAGRTAAWDSVTWSERGVHRIQRVLAALGFDTSGVLKIDPQELVGREVLAELQTEEWEDPATGRRQLRLSVPYAGYAPVSLPAAETGGRAVDGRACG